MVLQALSGMAVSFALLTLFAMNSGDFQSDSHSDRVYIVCFIGLVIARRARRRNAPLSVEAGEGLKAVRELQCGLKTGIEPWSEGLSEPIVDREAQTGLQSTRAYVFATADQE